VYALVLDLRNVNAIDPSSVQAIGEQLAEYESRGIIVAFVLLRPALSALLTTVEAPPTPVFESVADAVHWCAKEKSQALSTGLTVEVDQKKPPVSVNTDLEQQSKEGEGDTYEPYQSVH
jgi:hypothetical protein